MPRAGGFTHDSVDNQTQDWYTPPWVFEALGLQFTLDVAAPERGVPWIPALCHYSKEENGLAQPWEGLIWCNPPYGKETGTWLGKMHEHRNGVALVFARTDCAWFHDYVVKAAILFLKGRIRFVDGLGVTSGGGAGAGSLLVAWGPLAVEGLRRMSSRGFLVENTKQGV